MILYIVSSLLAGSLCGGIFFGINGVFICSIGLMLTSRGLIMKLFLRLGLTINSVVSEKIAIIIVMLAALTCNVITLGKPEFSMRGLPNSINYFNWENDWIVNWSFCSLALIIACRLMYRIFYRHDMCVAYLEESVTKILPNQK